MSEHPDLSPEEWALLSGALSGPLLDRDAPVLGMCLRLCGRGLLQRAGSVAAANGWRGSPHAFVLTREGWCAVRAERARRPLRRAG
jgi:hypothetical protein